MATPAEARARVHVRISGRVQGVGFRFCTVDEARRLGLTGWVRNTYDGGVEVVAEGEGEPLRQLVAWCHSGPPGARVVAVTPEWLAYSGEFDGFGIRH